MNDFLRAILNLPTTLADEYDRRRFAGPDPRTAPQSYTLTPEQRAAVEARPAPTGPNTNIRVPPTIDKLQAMLTDNQRRLTAVQQAQPRPMRTVHYVPPSREALMSLLVPPPDSTPGPKKPRRVVFQTNNSGGK